MTACEYNGCKREAEMHRPQPVDGAYNRLCRMCCDRIYQGFPHHKAAWEKLTTPPVNNVPTVNPVNQPTPTIQPSLF